MKPLTPYEREDAECLAQSKPLVVERLKNIQHSVEDSQWLIKSIKPLARTQHGIALHLTKVQSLLRQAGKELAEAFRIMSFD